MVRVCRHANRAFGKFFAEITAVKILESIALISAFVNLEDANAPEHRRRLHIYGVVEWQTKVLQ